MSLKQKLYLGADHVAYMGCFGLTTRHTHAAPVLLIGLSGRMTVALEGQVLDCRSILIDGNQPHTVDCHGEHVATLYLALDSLAGRALRREYLSGRSYAVDVISAAVFRSSLAGSILSGDVNRLLKRKLSLSKAGDVMDSRIETCLEMMRNDSELVLTQDDLAGDLNLSVSRLTHLFKAETGVSYRRYRLWHQLHEFMRDVSITQDMTRSALNCGFYDSPHLSNSYRKVFGVAPSRILSDLDELSVVS